jgi:hypothetical protein
MPFTAMGSKHPFREIGFCLVRKLSSYLVECRWFYSGANLCLKKMYGRQPEVFLHQ